MLSRMRARAALGRGYAVEGLDGWFFLSDLFEEEISHAVGLKSPPRGALEATAGLIQRFAALSRRQGAAFLFVPAPAKPRIYIDMLPAGLGPDPKASFLEKLLPRLDPGLYLDLRLVLAQARERAATFSRLNSHWTDFGAWIAWQAIETRLGQLGLPGSDRALTLTAIDEMDGFNEMEGLCGHKAANNWTFPQFAEPFADIIFDLADGTESPQLGRRAVQLGDMPNRVRNLNAGTKLSCLVVSDSSAVSLSPFLNRHFSFVRYVRHPLIGGETEAYDALCQNHFDLVMLAPAERYCLRLGSAHSLCPA